MPPGHRISGGCSRRTASITSVRNPSASDSGEPSSNPAVDAPAQARYTFPSLSTISPDKENIARLAVARLFDRMKGDEAAPASRSVEYRLVVRESTGGR